MVVVIAAVTTFFRNQVSSSLNPIGYVFVS